MQMALANYAASSSIANSPDFLQSFTSRAPQGWQPPVSPFDPDGIDKQYQGALQDARNTYGPGISEAVNNQLAALQRANALNQQAAAVPAALYRPRPIGTPDVLAALASSLAGPYGSAPAMQAYTQGRQMGSEQQFQNAQMARQQQQQAIGAQAQGQEQQAQFYGGRAQALAQQQALLFNQAVDAMRAAYGYGGKANPAMIRASEQAYNADLRDKDKLLGSLDNQQKQALQLLQSGKLTPDMRAKVIQGVQYIDSLRPPEMRSWSRMNPQQFNEATQMIDPKDLQPPAPSATTNGETAVDLGVQNPAVAKRLSDQFRSILIQNGLATSEEGLEGDPAKRMAELVRPYPDEFKMRAANTMARMASRARDASYSVQDRMADARSLLSLANASISSILRANKGQPPQPGTPQSDRYDTLIRDRSIANSDLNQSQAR
jgi:hypothetical protein